MRIGILTLPLHTNYGGILQAYALQTVLEKMGHEVVVIDTPHCINVPFYKWPYIYPKRIVDKYILGKRIRIFGEQYYNRTYPVISQNTQRFIDKYIHRKEVPKLSDLCDKDFEAIVVGSDQIWRPRYYPCIENAFLAFTEKWKIRRIAYATSFGTDTWEYTMKQTKRCEGLIRNFNAVSVREESGMKLCKRYLKFEAEHVLDPTMLLDSKDYIRLIKESDVPKSEGTLLNYILDESPEKDELINKVAYERNLKPFRVNSKVEDPFAPLEERIQPSVEQWLRGFYDAEFVITDSFHACVFSILFNKPFVVVANKDRGLARFESFLNLTGMQNNLISHVREYNDTFIKQPQNAWQKIVMYREKSMNYLSNSLYNE